jgi:hypothetical protein
MVTEPVLLLPPPPGGLMTTGGLVLVPPPGGGGRVEVVALVYASSLEKSLAIPLLPTAWTAKKKTSLVNSPDIEIAALVVVLEKPLVSM